MAKILWGTIGKRFYEIGVDRGVLYVSGKTPVAWDGLISVKETPFGGTPTPYYIDGVMYLNSSSPEGFSASIEAYYSPPEFDECDGIKSLAAGLEITQQSRKPFGISYRSKIGNDTSGSDFNYKIHIIYNALVAPVERSHDTLTNSLSANSLSWKILAKPDSISGAYPSPHVSINTATADPAVVTAIENILYGTSSTPPRLPSVDELVTIFGSTGPGPGPGLTVTVVAGPPETATISGSDSLVKLITSDTYEISSSSVVMVDASTYSISSS